MIINSDKIKIKIDPDLADIVPNYLKRRVSDTHEILSALKDGNFDRIQTLGHQMKGTGAGYGLDEITVLGAQIEDEAKAKCSEKLTDLAAKLAEYLNKIEITFE